MGLNALETLISRRTFIAFSGVSLLAITGCSRLRSIAPFGDALEVQTVIYAKRNFGAQLSHLANIDPVNAALLLTIAAQNEIHVQALQDVVVAQASPSSSAESTRALSRTCGDLRDAHAKAATRISDVETARVVIQISASENVHAAQLASANL